MGIAELLDEYAESAGADFASYTDKQVRWVQICVCGHEVIMHGHENGGDYGGPDWGKTVDGCAGPPPSRGTPRKRMAPDGMVHIDPTCPCKAFRPIAEVDRPGRAYRQKVWTKDRVHPLMRGLKAQRTRLAGSKAFGAAPDAELEKRFRWLAGAQKCRVCGTKSSRVIPCYVNDDRLSQMRCPDHYQTPYGEAP